jgi:hypothetical protein
MIKFAPRLDMRAFSAYSIIEVDWGGLPPGAFEDISADWGTSWPVIRIDDADRARRIRDAIREYDGEFDDHQEARREPPTRTRPGSNCVSAHGCSSRKRRSCWTRSTAATASPSRRSSVAACGSMTAGGPERLARPRQRPAR